MLAVINLFVYILKFPDRATTRSDIALLDIGTGHFGQIYHLTSSRLAVSFPRKVTELAGKVIEEAHTESTLATEPSDTLTPGGVLGQSSEINVSTHCSVSFAVISLDCAAEWIMLTKH